MWFYIDVLISFSNLAGTIYFSGMTPDNMLNIKTKYRYDYAMVFIVVVTWFRFFNYFLLVPKMSKLIITLI